MGRNSDPYGAAGPGRPGHRLQRKANEVEAGLRNMTVIGPSPILAIRP